MTLTWLSIQNMPKDAIYRLELPNTQPVSATYLESMGSVAVFVVEGTGEQRLVNMQGMKYVARYINGVIEPRPVKYKKPKPPKAKKSKPTIEFAKVSTLPPFYIGKQKDEVEENPFDKLLHPARSGVKHDRTKPLGIRTAKEEAESLREMIAYRKEREKADAKAGKKQKPDGLTEKQKYNRIMKAIVNTPPPKY